MDTHLDALEVLEVWNKKQKKELIEENKRLKNENKQLKEQLKAQIEFKK